MPWHSGGAVICLVLLGGEGGTLWQGWVGYGSVDFILLEPRFVQMKEGDTWEWVGCAREEAGSPNKSPGKENGVSTEGGDGHQRKIDALENYLGYTTSKFNLHWIIHLNVNPKTIKCLEESLRKTLMILGLAKIS